MKTSHLFIICLILFLLFGRLSYAVLDRYNVGVGYSAANQLKISTDTPGEFDYSLYLRTADNTAKTVSVHYTGISNLSRAITLSCGSDESNASDNPQSGTCLSGGPFVRGAFVAGNNNRYAVVKRFTLFCGSVQITGEQSTDNWSSGDFYNDYIKDFLDNGASSTWCPPTPSISPTPTKSLVKKSTPTPTKKPTVKITPTPTTLNQSTDETVPLPTEVPTLTVSSDKTGTSDQNNIIPILIAIGSIVAGSVVMVLVYKYVVGVKKEDPLQNSTELSEETDSIPQSS